MKSVKTVLSHKDIARHVYKHQNQDTPIQQQIVDNAFFITSLSLVSTCNASTTCLRNQIRSPGTSRIKNLHNIKRHNVCFAEIMPTAAAVKIYDSLHFWEAENMDSLLA